MRAVASINHLLVFRRMFGAVEEGAGIERCAGKETTDCADYTDFWMDCARRFVIRYAFAFSIANRRDAGGPCPAGRRGSLGGGALAWRGTWSRCRRFQENSEGRDDSKERKPRISQPERSEDGLANFLRNNPRQITRIFSTGSAPRYSVGNSFSVFLVWELRG